MAGLRRSRPENSPVVRHLHSWLERQPKYVVFALALVFFTLVAVSDFVTSPRVSTSIYYIAPIALSAWYLGKFPGVGVAAVSALSWSAKDAVLRDYGSAEMWILFWNGFARFTLFLVVALLLAELRIHLRREQQLAQRDGLTDVLNRRTFHERVAYELPRHERSGQALSLIYLDLDNFKLVNDRQGHAVGDRSLVTVAEVMRRELRRTDHVGRLGGDEFAVLLIDTDSPRAQQVANKLFAELRAAMKAQGWPIDFSLGVVTLPQGARTDPETLLHAADQAMYSVKARGKGGYVHYLLHDNGVKEAVPRTGAPSR
jgi:diguanylate cyclase (GGDEF)-like protein